MTLDPGIEIRSATLDDVIGIIYVQATTWVTDYVNAEHDISDADIRSIDFKTKVRDWQHMIQSPNYQVLVAAKDSGEILGVLEARRDEGSQSIETVHSLKEQADANLEAEMLTPVLAWLNQDANITCRVVTYDQRAIKALQAHNFKLSVEGEVDFINLPTGKSIPTIEMIHRKNQGPAADSAAGGTASEEPRNKPVERSEGQVSRSKLAKLSNLRDSTIKHYTEIGLLPFSQAGKRLARRYDAFVCLKRLAEIQQLRDQGYNLEDIKQRLQ